MLLESFQSHAVPDTTAPRVHAPEKEVSEAPDHEGSDYNDGLLPTALPIMIGAYALTLAIAAFTFSATASAVFVVGISGVYIAIFFAVPVVMARMQSRHDSRWRPGGPEKDSDRISVYTGTILRHEAILQMIIVPVVICFGFAAFGIILHFVR